VDLGRRWVNAWTGWWKTSETRHAGPDAILSGDHERDRALAPHQLCDCAFGAAGSAGAEPSWANLDGDRRALEADKVQLDLECERL